MICGKNQPFLIYVSSSPDIQVSVVVVTVTQMPGVGLEADSNAESLKGMVRSLIANRPMQVILGVALVSFGIGVGLRLWRGHHE